MFLFIYTSILFDAYTINALLLILSTKERKAQNNSFPTWVE